MSIWFGNYFIILLRTTDVFFLTDDFIVCEENLTWVRFFNHNVVMCFEDIGCGFVCICTDFVTFESLFVQFSHCIAHLGINLCT